MTKIAGALLILSSSILWVGGLLATAFNRGNDVGPAAYLPALVLLAGGVTVMIVGSVGKQERE